MCLLGNSAKVGAAAFFNFISELSSIACGRAGSAVGRTKLMRKKSMICHVLNRRSSDTTEHRRPAVIGS